MKRAVIVICALWVASVFAQDGPLPPVDSPPPLEPVKPEQQPKTASPSPWMLAPEEETEPKPVAARRGEGAPETTPADPEAHPAPAPQPVPVEEAQISAALAEAMRLEKKLREEKRPDKIKHEEIFNAFKGVIAAEPENVEAFYRLGLAYARSGRAQDGVVEIEKALHLDKDNARYLADLSTVAMHAGQLTRALEAALRAVDQDPNSAKYRNGVGNVLLAGGEFEQALAAYKQAVELAPNDARYIHNLARAFLSAEKAEDAIKWLNEVLRLEKGNAAAQNDLGVAHKMLGKMERAEECFKAALNLNPRYAEAHHNLALLYSADGDPRYVNRFAALDHARAAVKLTENRNPTYVMGLAEAFRANYSYDKAVETAKMAVAMAPTPYNLAQLEKYEKLKKDGYLDKVRMPATNP